MGRHWTLRQLITMWAALRVMTEEKLLELDGNIFSAMEALADSYRDDTDHYAMLQWMRSMITREQWRRVGYNHHTETCRPQQAV